MSFMRALCAAALCVCAAASAFAAPFSPSGDDTVLERLPWRPDDAARAGLRELRIALSQRPDDAALAAALARRYIELARQEADPRYLGYAQAALAPWWAEERPPAAIQLLRAIVRQANHDFGAALADLAAVLQREPRNAQAYFTRAAILQVRGDYAPARRDCARLAPLVSDMFASACLASVLSVNGEADRAYESLRRHRAAPERQWIHGLLAEIAARRNDPRAAEDHFRRALAAAGPDAYLLAAYSDFLLDQQRFEEVTALLRGHERADGLLLRLALAEQRLSSPRANGHIETLRARFAAARLRGDGRHLREEARYTLELRREPRAALALALRNFEQQREPADARLVLEAALAAADARAAQPVLKWLDQTRLQDPAIARLMQRLRGAVL